MTNDPDTSANKKIIASFVAVFIIVVMFVAVAAANKKSASNSLVSTAASQLSPTPTSTSPNTTGGTASARNSSTKTYKDGTYTATSSYETPGGQEDINVKLTVANGTVTATTIDQASNNRESAGYQTRFKQGYSSYVVGKKLTDIKISHVSGSSLTTDGFNQALDQIMTQATA